MEQGIKRDSFAQCYRLDLVISRGRCFSVHAQIRKLVNCGETVTEFGKDCLGSGQLTAPLSRKSRINVSAAYSHLIICLI